jgi:pyruvate,orthophosphate dikinase
MTQWVYSFGAGHNEGRADMRNLLGGKGANLAEMASIGLPVPPGFTITTEVCTVFYKNKRRYPEDLEGQVNDALKALEGRTGKKFGDVRNPLLVSVRSGSRASMPGIVNDVKVQVGDVVEEGKTLVVLEAMKMQNPLGAEAAGKITRIVCKKGEAVAAGALLLEME